VFKVQILRDRCKGCGLCLLFCKEEAISTSSQINEMGYSPAEPSEDGKCVGCKNCYTVCPEGIIEIVQEKEPNGSGLPAKKRREKK
jgi:2-oxoglutarate ferredoxin oxidoreductase subunit delta